MKQDFFVLEIKSSNCPRPILIPWLSLKPVEVRLSESRFIIRIRQQNPAINRRQEEARFLRSFIIHATCDDEQLCFNGFKFHLQKNYLWMHRLSRSWISNLLNVRKAFVTIIKCLKLFWKGVLYFSLLSFIFYWFAI